MVSSVALTAAMDLEVLLRLSTVYRSLKCAAVQSCKVVVLRPVQLHRWCSVRAACRPDSADSRSCLEKLGLPGCNSELSQLSGNAATSSSAAFKLKLENPPRFFSPTNSLVAPSS